MMHKRNMFVALITTAIVSSHTLMGIVMEPQLVNEGGTYYIRHSVPVESMHAGAPYNQFQQLSTMARIIDITGNKVGIAPSDICGYGSKMQGNVSDNDESTGLIVCRSGKVFDNVDRQTVSTTGTPAWIQFPRNYIGQTKLLGREGMRPGSGKKIIYLDRNQEVGIPEGEISTEYPENDIH